MFAIKGPCGQIFMNTVSESEEDCKYHFIHRMVDKGYIMDRPELYGEDYAEKMWPRVQMDGFECIRCIVKQHRDGDYGWPEVIEEKPQRELMFNESTVVFTSEDKEAEDG